MRRTKIILLMTVFAIISALSGCSQTKDQKITDIPVSTKSNDALASFQQGLILFDQGDHQKARTFFTKAIEQDPKLAVAYLFKSNYANTTKEFTDDLAKAKSNLEGAGDWEKMYFDYYNTFSTSDYNKRLEIVKKIAAMYPDAARAQVDLGFTYQQNNEYAKARECFQNAVKLNPKWVGGYSALFSSYLFNDPKDFKKAEENALKMVELAPSSSGAYLALGDCYRAQNNLEKARESYSRAIDLDPNYGNAYYKKGHANTFLDNLDEARQNYTDGGKHDVTKGSSILFIGNTYLYGGDYKTAMIWFTNQAAKLDSSGDTQDKNNTLKMECLGNSGSIALHYGEVAKLNEIVAMMETLSKQISNDLVTPEAKLTEKANILYWDALLAAAEGNYDSAKIKAEEIKTTLNPVNDPLKLEEYEFVLGYISMKQKKYPEAVSHFEKSNLNLVYNKYWLAMANEAAGNKDKANSLFKEVADYNFNDNGYALVRNEVKKKLAAQ